MLALKHGDPERMGWDPRLRRRFGYCTPDEIYEAAVANFVTSETEWLDVGCGRDVFPSNYPTAELLARRCRRLAGLDPSDNINANPLLHDRIHCAVEDYDPDRSYDLVTMRMVAEHIEDPRRTVAALARLVKPGGHVILYTVWKWSPASMMAAITPMSVHHWMKRLLWRTEERDTFPTFYRMNTRRALRAHFALGGFHEQALLRLDDTRALARWPWLAEMELRTWRMLRAVRLPYPEACLLGVYQKDG